MQRHQSCHSCDKFKTFTKSLPFVIHYTNCVSAASHLKWFLVWSKTISTNVTKFQTLSLMTNQKYSVVYPIRFAYLNFFKVSFRCTSSHFSFPFWVALLCQLGAEWPVPFHLPMVLNVWCSVDPPVELDKS